MREAPISEEAMALAKKYQLITCKPMFYIANVDELSDLTTHEHSQKIKAYCDQKKAICVPLCATIEAEIAELTHEEQGAFLADIGLEEPGLRRVVRVGYDLLSLQTFFTAGPKEVRAWTIRKGTLAPEAAGVIHTDFIKGFIRAEVIGFEDYLTHQGEQGAKDAGLWRLEGKAYEVNDGDVILFRTST